MIVFTILCIIALIAVVVIFVWDYNDVEPCDFWDWLLFIGIFLAFVLSALLLLCIPAIICFAIPLSDITTTEELIETKELRALNDGTAIEGKFSGEIFVSSGRINEKAVYAFYYEDKEDGCIRYGSIPAETTKIYLIGDNEKPRVETYMLYHSRITLLTAPVKVPVKESTIYKLYVPDGSITTDITLDLEK